MNKLLKIMLVVVLLIPMFSSNGVHVEAKRYKSSFGSTSSLARSRNNSSLNSLNKKNNYTSSSKSTRNNYSNSTRSRSFMRTGGGILGMLLIGNLFFGSSPFMSMITTILFWFLIIKLISGLFGTKRRTYQTASQGETYQNANNNHHMQQMGIINDLVNEASSRDIDVSYILDDEYTSLDEKITLIRQQLNKM